MEALIAIRNVVGDVAMVALAFATIIVFIAGIEAIYKELF